MNKLFIVLLLATASCTVPIKVKVKRKVKIEKTDDGYEIRLAKYKHRVPREDRLVIAVIDTGFDSKYENKVHLCKEGHKSFTGEESIEDEIGHGTHIVGLIHKNITVEYCMIILKYYTKGAKNGMRTSNEALRWAIDQKVDMINYSSGGREPNVIEKALIIEALDKGIVIVAAAGNENEDFKKEGRFYPALYEDEIIVVGNLAKDEKGEVTRGPLSNYGKQVDLQVFGTNIMSLNGLNTGTSQSTAIVTGRIAEHVRAHRLTEMVRKMNNEGTDSYYSPLYEYMR